MWLLLTSALTCLSEIHVFTKGQTLFQNLVSCLNRDFKERLVQTVVHLFRLY